MPQKEFFFNFFATFRIKIHGRREKNCFIFAGGRDPTTVSEHFLSHSNHSHTDMQLITLEKIHSSRDSVRKI